METILGNLLRRRRRSDADSFVVKPVERTSAILQLDENRFYYPASIAARVADPKKEPMRYERLRKNLYNWAQYRGARSSHPDNAVYEKGSQEPLTQEKNGRQVPVLLPGENYPSWYGRTWRSFLSLEELDEHEALRTQLMERLSRILNHHVDERLDSDVGKNQVSESSAPSGDVSSGLNFSVESQRKWLKGFIFGGLAAASVLLFFYFFVEEEKARQFDRAFLTPVMTQWQDLTLELE